MLMKTLFSAMLAGFFLLCGAAFGASLQLEPGLSLQSPASWESLDSDFHSVPSAVRHVLNCVDAKAGELRRVGWLMDGPSVQGAYCVSFRQKGMAKALDILKKARGREREAAADRFADAIAALIQAGYNARRIHVDSMRAETIEAGTDVVMVLDGIVRDGTKEFLRSETVFLHGDGMLSIGAVQDAKASPSVSAELEAIPLSVQWR